VFVVYGICELSCVHCIVQWISDSTFLLHNFLAKSAANSLARYVPSSTKFLHLLFFSVCLYRYMAMHGQVWDPKKDGDGLGELLTCLFLDVFISLCDARRGCNQPDWFSCYPYEPYIASSSTFFSPLCRVIASKSLCLYFIPFFSFLIELSDQVAKAPARQALRR